MCQARIEIEKQVCIEIMGQYLIRWLLSNNGIDAFLHSGAEQG